MFPDCALLTEQDQNVLLKVVEEGRPTRRSSSARKNAAVVLQTLRSRCVELKLHPAAEAAVKRSRRQRPCAAAWPPGSGKGDGAGGAAGEKRITREDLSALLERSRALCAAALLLQYGQEPEESCREIAPISRKT